MVKLNRGAFQAISFIFETIFKFLVYRNYNANNHSLKRLCLNTLYVLHRRAIQIVETRNKFLVR